MSAPLPPSGDQGSADPRLDPMDELTFSVHNLMLFTRVVASFADDLMAEFHTRNPLTWKVEALALLCNKTGGMAQKLCKTAEEARKHAT